MFTQGLHQARDWHRLTISLLVYKLRRERRAGKCFLFLNTSAADITPNAQAFSGMFKSDLILTVLYGHLKDTASVSPELASPYPPRAAVALAAAAVSCSSSDKHYILTNPFTFRLSVLSNAGKRVN